MGFFNFNIVSAQEISFTPVVEGTVTPGAAIYTVQVGTVVKIGNYISGQLTVTYSGHTGTGNVKITGLPFVSSAAKGNNAAVDSGVHAFIGSGPASAVKWEIAPSSDEIISYTLSISGIVVNNILQASGQYSINFSYFV